MGAIVFIIFSIVAIYVLSSLIRGLNTEIGSARREAFALGYPRAQMPVEPIVTPVDEVKIPERLPQIKLDPVGMIVPPTPPPDRSTAEVSPNFAMPAAKTEESLLFRSLGLGMFAISVISVDFAAGTHYALVAIPFTTVGAVWSWYRRHYAQHWLNMLVSVASVAIVFALIPSLARQTQLTGGLVLAILTIGLQMGLSFHLYNRQLLGYCLASSGVLMSVAAGLSQNIIFLILLSGWMAIGIPALMLDYRSRLALKPVGISAVPQSGQLSYRHLPWRYLYRLAAISIGLGLMLSVFLPNFRFPDLSFQPPNIDRPQTITRKADGERGDFHPSTPTTNNPPPNPTEIAPKLFGQPGNNNYPDTIKQEHLQLPPELASQLPQLTQKILATSPQPLNSDYDRAAYLAEYLKQHHQADSKQLPLANLPPIDAKSIQQLTAKCAANPQTCKLAGNKQDIPVIYTSMLRSIGIPTRLKTGGQPAQIDPQTQMYPRPSAESQSQTEVYFPNWGWFGLDSTPDRPLLNVDNRQLAQLQEQLQQISPSTAPTPPARSPAPPTDRSPSTTPTPPAAPTNSTPAPASNPPKPPLDLPEWNPDPGILRTLAIAIAIGCGIAWYFRQQQQQQQQLASLPPIEQIYRSMLTSLSKSGRTKLPTQTQLEYAQTIGTTEHPQIAKVVGEISQLYTAWRYGKQRIDINQLAKKLQYLQHLQHLAIKRQRQQWLAQAKARWIPGNLKTIESDRKNS